MRSFIPPRNCRITVGLLGGSFNPAHQGHRYISIEAIKRLGLDEVWWLISPQNPLKPAEGMYPFEKRVEIAESIANHPKIKISTLEKQFKTQYTRDSLLKLQEKYPGIRFIWLMGSDNLEQIPHWYRWHDIVKTIPIVVFERGNNSFRALRGKMAHYYSKYRLVEPNIRDIAAQQPPVWASLKLRKHPGSATTLRKSLDNALLKGYNEYIGRTK